MSLNHLSYASKYEIPYIRSGPTGPTGPQGPQGPTGPTGPEDPNPNFESASIDGIPVATEQYVNNKWNTLGAWQAPVLSRTGEKPEEINVGDRFLITPDSLDLDWADYPDNILTYTSPDEFEATQPTDGMVVFAKDTDFIWLYNGAEWVRLSIQVNHNAMLGIQGGTTAERYHIDAVTATNLAGLTSPVQVQLNDKLPKQDPNILGQLQLNGTGSGTTPLQFTNTGGIKSSGPIRVTPDLRTLDTKKIVLWEDNEATTYKYYGLGLSPNSLDYRSVGLAGTHNWYTSSNDGNTSLQLMSLGRHSLQVINTINVDNPIADIRASGSKFMNSNGSVSLSNSAYFGSGIVMVNTENTESQKRCDIGIDTNGDVVFRVGSNNFNQPIAMRIRNNRAIEFPALTATRVPIIDTNQRLTVSNVTPTELGYLTGTTSAIQTQINEKFNTSGGTLTGPLKITPAINVASGIRKLVCYDAGNESTVFGYNGIGNSTYSFDYHVRSGNSHNWWVNPADGLTPGINIMRANEGGFYPLVGTTPNRAAIIDANQKLITSNVTTTELGYLSGVTSAVQTQLNNISTSIGRRVMVRLLHINGETSILTQRPLNSVNLEITVNGTPKLNFVTSFTPSNQFATISYTVPDSLKYNMEIEQDALYMACILRSSVTGERVTWPTNNSEAILVTMICESY